MVLGKKMAISDWEWSRIWAPREGQKIPWLYVFYFQSFAKTRPVATEASQGLVSKYSNTVSFSLRDKDGNKKKVKNLPNPIPITINRDVNAPPDDLKVEFANPEIPPREWEVFFYHTVNKPEKPSWTSMHLIFRPTNTSRFNQLLVTVSFGADMPDVEKENIEHVCMIPSHTDLWGRYTP